jgi:hypothetical protein
VNIQWNDFIPDAPVFDALAEANFLRALANGFEPLTPAEPNFDGINEPSRPTLAAFTVPDIGTIPELTVAEPIIDLPDAPTMDLPGAPTGAPTFNAPALPDKPQFTLPDVPTFSPVAIPEPENIEIPLFDADTDFGDIVSPTQEFNWSEEEYQSALLDATRAKILDDILNGGYGIDDDDERRLWDRARERELLNTATKLQEVARITAARGFTLPPGALYALEQEAQQSALEKNSSLSRDIAIKRGDMYVENRRFIIQEARQMEDMLIRYHGAMAERALNAARAQVEFGIALFNAQIAKFQARLEQFRAYAQVYEARVRAALAGVEIFKAKVEGARLTVETQKLYADVYRTQLEGVQALLGAYRTEMEAAQIAANIETLKLQGFRAQVEVFAEQVRAKSAEFGMFESQIRGELAKVQIYDSSVRAYSSRLDAVRTRAAVADTRARTEIAQADATVRIYQSDLDAYRARIGVVSEKNKAALDRYQGQLSAYSTKVGAFQTAGQMQVSAEEANARIQVAHAQMVGERLRATIQEYIKIVDTLSGKYVQTAQTQTQLASAWVNSVTGITAELVSS